MRMRGCAEKSLETATECGKVDAGHAARGESRPFCILACPLCISGRTVVIGLGRLRPDDANLSVDAQVSANRRYRVEPDGLRAARCVVGAELLVVGLGLEIHTDRWNAD